MCVAGSEKGILFAGARDELRQSKEAILEYQQKTKQDPNLMVKANHSTRSWNDVREAIKVAKDHEDDKDKESWSVIESCDKIVENISAFEAWLDLLPGGDYGAVVSAVFMIVVTVWAFIPARLVESSHSQASKCAHDVRVTILQALADISYWVGRANRYRDLHKEAKPRELMQMTAQLCSAVLVALRNIMVYLTESTLSMNIQLL